MTKIYNKASEKENEVPARSLTWRKECGSLAGLGTRQARKRDTFPLLIRADYYPHLEGCHSERSEESQFYASLDRRFFTPLCFVQNDKTTSTLDRTTYG